MHELLTEVAREENLQVDPDAAGAAARRRTRSARSCPPSGGVPAEQLVPELVYRARGFDAYANDNLLLDALAKKYLGRDSAKYNVAVVANEDAARELAEKIVASPARTADLMRAAATERGRAGDRPGHRSFGRRCCTSRRRTTRCS